MNVQSMTPSATIAGFPAGFFADICRDRQDQPVVRVSRLEAMLADVFEKGMSAVAPSSGPATLQ